MPGERVPWATYPTASCPRGCRYLARSTHTCDYYLTTGIRRPCPAGRGCTVAETGRGKRIETAARALEPSRPGWDVAKALELRRLGWSYQRIADEVGATESQLSVYGREHDWPKAAPRLPSWDVDKGRAMLGAGASLKEIAAACGVKYSTVGSYAADHWPDVQVERIRWDKDAAEELWRGGASDEEIAQAVGASAKAIGNYRRLYWGAPRNRDGRATAWDTELGRALYDAGWRLKEIAPVVGITASAISSYRQRHWGPRRGGDNVAKKAGWDVAKGLEMYMSGASDPEIVDACGAPSEQAVGSYRRAHWAAVPRNREAAEKEPGGGE